MRTLCIIIFTIIVSSTKAQQIVFVELNCENLFDTHHDEGKEDFEFLPDGFHHWTAPRYWHKLNTIGQALLATSPDMPDLIALVEVENDSVLIDLTQRSLLRNAGYQYLMTTSNDTRGLDVALLYQPARFRPICYETISVTLPKGTRPTRDILYVKGKCISGDTLHVFVVHAPSRYGGERDTRPYRKQVALTLLAAIDSIRHESYVDAANDSIQHAPHIVVAGDFNDYDDSPALLLLGQHLDNVTAQARGANGALASYRYQGDWHSLDHVFASPSLSTHVDTAYIADPPFLLEPDDRYGGVKPRRTFIGPRHHGGISDHLPLVVRFAF